MSRLRPCRLAAFALLAGAGLFLARAPRAWTTIGGNLPLDQRDFRVFNNFADATANDNQTAHPHFPGALGAEMACWKAAAEWGSLPYVDGTADPTQTRLGDGGANFEFLYMGKLASYGPNPQVGDNTIFAVSDLGSGVLAATYSYSQGNPPGWFMAVSERYTWNDGPGNHSNMDLQGVVCHELGHSLRLGHSSVTSATMYYAVSGNGVAQRSIEADDIAGTQAIYGARSAAKPAITATAGSFLPGQTMTLTGQNFAATGNEVWFTGPAVRTPAKALNVPSTAGGTQISCTVPAGAKAGNVAVKIPGASAWCLSNAWPYDPGKVTAPPQLLAVSPSAVPNLGGGLVALTGSNLASATEVRVGTLKYGSGSFHVVNDAKIEINAPDPPPALGLQPVVVVNAIGPSQAVNLDIQPADPPLLTAPSITASYGIDQIRAGHRPGFVGVLLVSFSDQPSILPGLVSLGLGNGFASLYPLATLGFDAALGRAALSLPIPPGFGGVTYFLQLVAIDPANPGRTPLVVSNVTKTLIFI